MDDFTQYFRLPGGAVSRVALSQGEPVLPKGAAPISREEYETRRAALKEGTEAHVADLVADVQAKQREDYEALIALQVPEATARRLTGHTEEAQS